MWTPPNYKRARASPLSSQQERLVPLYGSWVPISWCLRWWSEAHPGYLSAALLHRAHCLPLRSPVKLSLAVPKWTLCCLNARASFGPAKQTFGFGLWKKVCWKVSQSLCPAAAHKNLWGPLDLCRGCCANPVQRSLWWPYAKAPKSTSGSSTGGEPGSCFLDLTWKSWANKKSRLSQTNQFREAAGRWKAAEVKHCWEVTGENGSECWSRAVLVRDGQTASLLASARECRSKPVSWALRVMGTCSASRKPWPLERIWANSDQCLILGENHLHSS